MQIASKIYTFINKEINQKFFNERMLEFDVIGLNDFNKRVFFIKMDGDKLILNEIHQLLEDLKGVFCSPH